MLLPSPIRPFYPISRSLKTLQQNLGGDDIVAQAALVNSLFDMAA
jgi:hypothetical protein